MFKRAALLILVSGALAIAGNICTSQPTTVAITNKGEVMAQPRIHFIFWGSYWSVGGAGSTLADSIVRTFNRVPQGYWSGLAQYGVQSPELAGMTVATAYEPPSYVTEGTVVAFLQSLMESRILPKLSRSVYYIVLLPKGTLASFRGYHTYFRDLDGSTTWFSWVTTNGDTLYYDVFHELVEGMTDPEGRGVQTVVPVKSPKYWSEIADACEAACTGTGIRVAPYWSQADGACVTGESRGFRGIAYKPL